MPYIYFVLYLFNFDSKRAELQLLKFKYMKDWKKINDGL